MQLGIFSKTYREIVHFTPIRCGHRRTKSNIEVGTNNVGSVCLTFTAVLMSDFHRSRSVVCSNHISCTVITQSVHRCDQRLISAVRSQCRHALSSSRQ